MLDPIPATNVTLKKQGAYVNVSYHIIWDSHWAERFPRKHHTVTHPITKAQQKAYDNFAGEWEAIESARAALIAKGQKAGWATGEGGYDWEPAGLVPLEPRVEVVYEETEQEWRDRVTPIIQHHHETGVWLEEPEPTYMERMMSQSLKAMSVAFDDPETGT